MSEILYKDAPIKICRGTLVSKEEDFTSYASTWLHQWLHVAVASHPGLIGISARADVQPPHAVFGSTSGNVLPHLQSCTSAQLGGAGLLIYESSKIRVTPVSIRTCRGEPSAGFEIV